MQEPPPLARALLDTLRATVELARGEDVAGLLADLRRYWHKDGLLPIHASPMEMELAGRRGDAAGVLSSYDDAVETITRIWHPWFTARIRLAAVAIGELARVMPQLPAAERPTYVEHADRLQADGHTVLERYTDPEDSWGPEGRAWVKRLDAEALRVHWLAGAEPPPGDVLVSTWQEAASLTEEFGDVYELARLRAVLAGIQRAVGDTAAAREVGDLARSTAHDLGAQPLLDDLRSIGSAPARAAAGASDALTPREAEILGLVAEGRSNGEIGRAAVHQHQDRERARVQHPRQARCRWADRGRRDRPSAGAARLTSARRDPRRRGYGWRGPGVAPATPAGEDSRQDRTNQRRRTG